MNEIKAGIRKSIALAVMVILPLASGVTRAADSPTEAGKGHTTRLDVGDLKLRVETLVKESATQLEAASALRGELDRYERELADLTARIETLENVPTCSPHESLFWSDGYRCRPDPSGPPGGSRETDDDGCSDAVLQKALASMSEEFSASREELAVACVDGVNPTVASNYPEKSADHKTRFMNTCGNRFCRQKGYFAGSVVEYFNRDATVQCRRKDPPADIPAACTAELKKRVPPISTARASWTQIAQACIDAVNPMIADSLPTSPVKTVRFMNTCGSRYCKQLGHTGGRVIESYKGSAIVECSNNEALDDEVALVRNMDANVDDIARACIDGVNPTMADSLPTSTAKAMRFVNTCGNRFCQKKDFARGRVTEYYKNDATLECWRN